MSLSAGKNQLRIQVIDTDSDTIKSQLEYFDLSGEQLVFLEETICNAVIGLGKAAIALKKK